MFERNIQFMKGYDGQRKELSWSWWFINMTYKNSSGHQPRQFNNMLVDRADFKITDHNKSYVNKRTRISFDYDANDELENVLWHEIMPAFTGATVESWRTGTERRIVIIVERKPDNVMKRPGDIITGTIEQASMIIQQFHRHQLIDRKTCESLLSDLVMPVQPAEMYSYIIELSKQDSEAALQLALTVPDQAYPNAVWFLAKQLEGRELFQSAERLYRSIKPDSVHYIPAQQAIIHLISQMLAENNGKQFQLSDAEVHAYREEMFRLSVVCQDARMSSKLFFELSAFPMASDHPDILANAETLLLLSRLLAERNQKIQALEKQVSRLSRSEQGFFQAANVLKPAIDPAPAVEHSCKPGN